MTGIDRTRETALRALIRPLRLTQMGMVAERATQAFWPFWTIALAVLALLAFGVQDHLSAWALWGAFGVAGAGLAGSLAWGLRRFRWPDAAQALARLDSTLPGRSITALTDQQAIGATDPASQAVWQLHMRRVADSLRAVRPARPDLRLSRNDPFGLRYVAVIGFVAALAFGSLWRVAEIGGTAAGPAAALASGPAWEGWVEPPAYTGKPTLYLNDIAAGELAAPLGSRVVLRFYGAPGMLKVDETVSGGTTGENDMAPSFDITKDGLIDIDGPGGRRWSVTITPDTAPVVDFAGEMGRPANGEMQQPFTAGDDYGVVAGNATITLDLNGVTRLFGLATEPDARAPLVLDLPMPISGARDAFTETLVDNLSQHPWAGLPVQITLAVTDARGQSGQTQPLPVILPGRRFFDPLAKAIIEQRRDLLWARGNGPQVAQVLRAISYQPDDIFRDPRAYLQLRVAIRRLETGIADTLTPEKQDEIAQVLWDIATLIEDGNLSDARERLKRAQDRLSEAMRNGASDAEIADLMQELREAMDDYLRQLAQNPQPDDQQQAQNQDMQQITGDQLQQMLDQIQELMEQGRMAEAQALMDQLAQMMENMQVTQGQGGGQGQGQQALQGLSETLRDQQDLSDDAFRDLQEQFNPGGQNGPGQGQQQGGQGDGQQQGQSPGERQQQSLADRQQALRDELQRQQQGLPGIGGAEGQATREALDRAGRAMEQAEDSLRQNDIPGALDRQAQAMDALRDGIRDLGDALAQLQQDQQPGQQGRAMGSDSRGMPRDPLGRELGALGRLGTDENMLQGEDVYGRARKLLDEIRRRSADQSRPEAERDYLKRLLDRF